MTLYDYIDAVEFATIAHDGQRRKFGVKEPYVAHPIRVSKKVLQVTEDYSSWYEEKRLELAIAAVLHDVIEDTPVKAYAIADSFGESVKTLVESVTKNTALPKADKEMEFLLRYKSSPVETVIIKLADRLDNLQSMSEAPLDFQRKYLANTKQLLSAVPKKAENNPSVNALEGPILRLIEEITDGL